MRRTSDVIMGDIRVQYLISVACFTAAFMVLLHQYVIWGYWWEPYHVIGLHHESIALVLVLAGVVNLTVIIWQQRR